MGAERTEQRDECPWVAPAWDHLNFSQNKWPMTRETGKSGRILGGSTNKDDGFYK